MGSFVVREEFGGEPDVVRKHNHLSVVAEVHDSAHEIAKSFVIEARDRVVYPLFPAAFSPKMIVSLGWKRDGLSGGEPVELNRYAVDVVTEQGAKSRGGTKKGVPGEKNWDQTEVGC